MLIEHAPQAGGLRIAWAVERPDLDTGGGHDRNRKMNRRPCSPNENTCTHSVEPEPAPLEVKIATCIILQVAI